MRLSFGVEVDPERAQEAGVGEFLL